MQIFEDSFSGITFGVTSGYFTVEPTFLNGPFNTGAAFFNTFNNGTNVVTNTSGLGTSYPQATLASNVYVNYKPIWMSIEVSCTSTSAGDGVQVTVMPYNMSNSTVITGLNQNTLNGQPGAVTGMAQYSSPVLKLKSFVTMQSVLGLTRPQVESQFPSNIVLGTVSTPYQALYFIRWGLIDNSPPAANVQWTVKIRMKCELSNRQITPV